MNVFLKRNGEPTYDITINIKAYKEITERDKERINKIALLINSLGFDEDTIEKDYRFYNESEDDELLLDVEKITIKEK